MVRQCSAPVAAPLRGKLKRRVLQMCRRRVSVVLSALLLLAPLRAPGAQTLGLTLSPSTLTGFPGSTLTFSGQIINVTGISLNSTDFFLNFTGYDPLVFVDVLQILGMTSFVVPHNTVSAVVPLFSVIIASTALPGDYGFSVTLQDVNDVTSNEVTPIVTVQAPSSVVPEPSTLALLGSGFVLLPAALALRRRRTAAQP